MRYIEGNSRQQTSLLPPSLDEFVAADHPARVIDAFVDSQPFAELGFTHSSTAHTGRKPYHPGDLLKLYIYAYLNQTPSSRVLEKECHRNVEVMWLLKRLAPDFKTIADFRKDNGEAIKKVCRSFIVFCREAGLVTGTLVAVDGSKFKAAASKDRVVTKQGLSKQLVKLDAKIESYLSALQQNDGEDVSPELDVSRVEEALAYLNQAKSDAQGQLDELNEHTLNQRCETEPEAKLMRSGRDGTVAGYNVQNAVDSQHQIIVHHELTQDSNDTRQLKPMVEAINEVLGSTEKVIVADAGYSNGEQVSQSQSSSTHIAVPANRSRNNQGDFYQKSDFSYLEQDDVFVCPAGERLNRKTISNKDKLVLYNRTGCDACHLQSKCTKSNTRWVTRHFYEDALNQATKRATPALMKRRMQIVEPPFGTLKRMQNNGRFRCWGKKAVASEYSLAVLSYNLLRAMNVVGSKRLINMLS